MEYITSRKISDTLYQLNEIVADGFVMHMYLVIGEKKAALIDTGYGLSGQLRDKVESITDKPVEVLLTHSDPDHAGGAAQFDEICMSEKERKLLEGGSINPKARLANAKAVCHDEERMKYYEEHMVKADTFAFKPITDGQIFDLGGEQLEAIDFPGHTPGSVCFWNQKENYCLVGDAVANVHSPVLFFPKCLPLTTYRDNLHHFLNKVGEDCDLYSGHNEKKLEKEMYPEIFTEIDEILGGDTADDQPYLPPFINSTSDIPAPVMEVMKKKVLGDAKPMEHSHPGYLATIKYNANKLQ